MTAQFVNPCVELASGARSITQKGLMPPRFRSDHVPVVSKVEQPPKDEGVQPQANAASSCAGSQPIPSGATMPPDAERLLGNAIEFFPDATFVIDAEKRVVAWNRACELLTGVKKEALLGRGDFAYAEPFYGECRPILIDLLDLPESEIEARYSYVQRKGTVVFAETFVARLRDGQGAYLWGEATALFDREGRRCGAVESIRDITERKQSEAKLLQREATIQSVFGAVPVGICIMKDRRFLSANRYWCEEFGYPEASIIGQSTRTLFESDAEWQRVGEEVYSHLDEKSQASARTRLRRSDGTWRDVVITAARIHQADPTSATAVIIHDITEQNRAEAALRLRNLILSTQQEASPDGILVVDDHGEIVSCNRKFREMWRMPQGILAAGSDDRALDWARTQLEYPDEFIRSVRELYAHPERSDVTELALKDGRSLERYSSPMVAEDGRCLGRVWYFRDITARKRAEVARDKAEEQLWRSQKMEAIGSLAGGVAHDFNNLLSVIMSFTGFAQEQVREGDPLAADLEEVRKAAERAATLTQQLLAFGRKQVLHPVSLDLNGVAKGLEGMLRRIVGEDIDIVFTLAQGLGSVRVDAGQFEQVLMNLVVNARDAMQGGGRLTVNTSNLVLSEESPSDAGVMPPGHYVQLAVTDTGCGMDEPTKSRIFEPFFTTKEKGRGTGLGLSTVYGIVKQSGGDISVSSELGHGTTFRIRLPREAAPSVSLSHRSPAPRPRGGTETILVVEDEEALRAVARRALTEAGYTVLLAANGDEAVGLCTRYREDIHLLLTDVVMPGMSGPSLARELSRNRVALEIIYMSGYADSAFDHHGQLEAGAQFLGKPFTAVDITRKVRDVLDHRER
jgi:two-component system, cell cycle sensor histidine kinase and response regulator CckA